MCDSITRNCTNNPTRHVRCVDENNINALICDLNQHRWLNVLDTDDANLAYNFMSDFIEKFNKHCPLKVIRHDEVRKKYDKPCLTKGIQNACIKKNHLYKTFLARRTVSTETRYKTVVEITPLYFHVAFNADPKKTQLYCTQCYQSTDPRTPR